MAYLTRGSNSGSFPTDLKAKSFASMITRLYPNGNSPLFGLSSMLETETAVDVEHGFFTKTMVFPEATLGAAIANGTDTTVTVVSSAMLLPGMVLRAQETGENLLVLTVASSTSITVARGVGTVSAAAVTNSTKLYQVGTAFEEGSSRPNPMNIQAVRITNYTQIFRDTWAVTGSAAAVGVIAGDSPTAENKNDCAAFHAANIEKALFFGQKSTATRNGQPFRTMDGILSVVGNASYYPAIYGGTPNITTAGSTTSLTQLEAALDVVFNQNTDPKIANERILFVGGTARRVINKILTLNGTYQLNPGQTEWGLSFDSLKLTRGTFRIIEHPLFNTNTHWSKMAVALDLSSFRLAYLGDRKTKHEGYGEGNGSDNGTDALGGTLTTEMTCTIKNPPANAVISNLTAAAAG